MKNTRKLSPEFIEMLKIADKHAAKINLAIEKLRPLFPMIPDQIDDISDDVSLWIDQLLYRFAKLQDYLGKKIINEFLLLSDDSVENLMMLDKINMLEKLGIVDHSELWQDIREARNHVSHEYPDNNDKAAKYLNEIFEFTPYLLEILYRIKEKLGLEAPAREPIKYDIKQSSMVRLPEETLQHIINLFHKYFLSNDKLWVFGSRADLSRKGGDIDLYIETDMKDALDAEANFLRELEMKIGEQKVDVVLNVLAKNNDLPIYEIAKSKGVRIV